MSDQLGLRLPSRTVPLAGPLWETSQWVSSNTQRLLEPGPGPRSSTGGQRTHNTDPMCLGLHLPRWPGACGGKMETETNLSQHRPVFPACPALCSQMMPTRCRGTLGSCLQGQNGPPLLCIPRSVCNLSPGNQAEPFEFQNSKARPLAPIKVSGSLSAPLSPVFTLSWKTMGSHSRKKAMHLGLWNGNHCGLTSVRKI